MAWMTGERSQQLIHRCIFFTSCSAPGIYHGTLNFESNSDDLIDAAQLLPYPSFPPSSPPLGVTSPQIPVSIALTEFHFILLYSDRIVGICNLDERLTYDERLPLVCLKALSVIYLRFT